MELTPTSPPKCDRRRQSPAAEAHIKSHEALRLRAYLDPVGVWTIGWGSTRGVWAGMVVDESEAERRFQDDAAEAVRTIYRHLPADLIESLPQLSFDALVSFIFNVGGQAFSNPKTEGRTDFHRVITGPSLADVAAQMRRWVYGGGRVLPGLVKRREQEASMWLAGLGAAKEPNHG